MGYISANQKYQFWYILEGVGMENVGLFYGHLAHFRAIWYIFYGRLVFFSYLVIFFTILVYCTKKNLATTSNGYDFLFAEAVQTSWHTYRLQKPDPALRLNEVLTQSSSQSFIPRQKLAKK
jgi:hypothetical protein